MTEIAPPTKSDTEGKAALPCEKNARNLVSYRRGPPLNKNDFAEDRVYCHPTAAPSHRVNIQKPRPYVSRATVFRMA